MAEGTLWARLSAEPPVVLEHHTRLPSSFGFTDPLFASRHHRAQKALRAPRGSQLAGLLKELYHDQTEGGKSLTALFEKSHRLVSVLGENGGICPLGLPLHIHSGMQLSPCAGPERGQGR